MSRVRRGGAHSLDLACPFPLLRLAFRFFESRLLQHARTLQHAFHRDIPFMTGVLEDGVLRALQKITTVQGWV